MPDKFTATWVSHSSIKDFLKCPRAYYLNNVYKDPITKHKISITSPPLSLGSAVHEVVESLSTIKTDERFKIPLIEKFEISWSKVSGKKGGFTNKDMEQQYKNKGLLMLEKLSKNPGPLKNLAVKIHQDLPHYYLSEADNIILCGKIDWLEYLKDTDSVHIIDFKTGKNEEGEDSLQLPIYLLLATNCQKHPVVKASYWYLQSKDSPTEVTLPPPTDAYQKVLKIAKQISLARKLNKFSCPQKTGCSACKPLEAVINGRAEYVGENDYHQDIYILPQANATETSSIL